MIVLSVMFERVNVLVIFSDVLLIVMMMFVVIGMRLMGFVKLMLFFF